MFFLRKKPCQNPLCFVFSELAEASFKAAVVLPPGEKLRPFFFAELHIGERYSVFDGRNKFVFFAVNKREKFFCIFGADFFAVFDKRRQKCGACGSVRNGV